jgi:hypothetical protein
MNLGCLIQKEKNCGFFGFNFSQIIKLAYRREFINIYVILIVIHINLVIIDIISIMIDIRIHLI